MTAWIRAGRTRDESFPGFLGGGWVRPRAWRLRSAEGLAEVTRTQRRTGVEGWFLLLSSIAGRLQWRLTGRSWRGPARLTSSPTAGGGGERPGATGLPVPSGGEGAARHPCSSCAGPATGAGRVPAVIAASRSQGQQFYRYP